MKQRDVVYLRYFDPKMLHRVKAEVGDCNPGNVG